MKKYISLIICAVLLFSLSSCSVGKAPILDNSDNSYFVDFYTDDDYVYIDNEDVEIGLLKSKNLVAIDKESEKDVFRLKSGENTITVLFRGEYAGIYQITSREIPRFIYISEN